MLVIILTLKGKGRKKGDEARHYLTSNYDDEDKYLGFNGLGDSNKVAAYVILWFWSYHEPFFRQYCT